MVLNVVYPSGLSSGRAFVNLDWISLLMIVGIAVLGVAYLFAARPDRNVERHLQGTVEPPEAPAVVT
jgi:hypothetical protein